MIKHSVLFAALVFMSGWDCSFGLAAEPHISMRAINAILDQIVHEFEPDVAQYGGRLVKVLEPDVPAFQATAKINGEQWQLIFLGGAIRQPYLTSDGFTLIACHELGHLLGGYPMSPGRQGFYASEGQADYFAAQVCARRLWASEHRRNSRYANIPSPMAQRACRAVWSTPETRNLCLRIAAAAHSLTRALARSARGGHATQL